MISKQGSALNPRDWIMRRLLARLCIATSNTAGCDSAKRFTFGDSKSRICLAALWGCAACTALASEPLWAGNPNPEPREPLQVTQTVGRFFGVGYSSGYHAHYAQHASKLSGNKLSSSKHSGGKHSIVGKHSSSWPSGSWLSGSNPSAHRSQALTSATEYWTILARPEPFVVAVPYAPPVPSAAIRPDAAAVPLHDPTRGDDEHAVEPKGESAGRSAIPESEAIDAAAPLLQSPDSVKPANKSSRLGCFLQPEASPDPRDSGTRGSELIKTDRSPSDRLNRQP